MPRKRSNSSAPAPRSVVPQPYKPVKDAQWGGFINIRLTDEDKVAFREWQRSERLSTGDLLDGCLRDGLQISFTYDSENWCYMVTLTGKGWLDSPLRCAMTTRGETFTDALDLALFKHLEMANEDWGQYKSSGWKSEI